MDVVLYETNQALSFSGEGILTSGPIKLLDGATLTNKTLPGVVSKEMPDLLTGCEWPSTNDHMDYPKNALRIQSARAIHDASTIYLVTPTTNRAELEVLLFNIRMLRKARVPIAVVSLARNENERSSEKDLNGYAALIGLSDEEISRGRAMLEKLTTTRYEHAYQLEQPR